MLGVSGLLVLCMVVPYLPGSYDSLATTLSSLAQLVGLSGVVFVPLGLVWLAYELRLRGRSVGVRPATDWGYVIALISIGIASVIAALSCFLAALEFASSLALGLLAFALWTAIAWCFVARLRDRRSAEVRCFDAAPFYFVAVPAVLMAVRLSALEPLSRFARERAIANSAPLIADIERHRTEQGHYPSSLLAVHDDYELQVMGVPRYLYARHGEGYTLAFEIMSITPGTREFVAYNPRDEHALPGHDSDQLLWTPAQRAVRPGHNALENGPAPHWKCFLFD